MCGRMRVYVVVCVVWSCVAYGQESPVRQYRHWIGGSLKRVAALYARENSWEALVGVENGIPDEVGDMIRAFVPSIPEDVWGALYDMIEKNPDHAAVFQELSKLSFTEIRSLVLQRPQDLREDWKRRHLGHRLIMYGHQEAMKLVLDSGVDVHERDWVGHTLLDMAAINCHVEAVRTLFQRGANPDLGQSPHGALSEAVSMGRPDVVDALLQGGARVDIVDEHGKTIFDRAKEREYAVANDRWPDARVRRARELARRIRVRELIEAQMKQG